MLTLMTLAVLPADTTALSRMTVMMPTEGIGEGMLT